MTKSHLFRAFIANAWLGWQQEGNWVHPVLYLLFALLAPIAGILMLVFMYLVVKGDASEPSFLMFLMAGSAMFMFIRMIIAGMAFAVIEDREHYKILRYVYIAPVPLSIQITGRAVGRAVIALVGMIATFAAGSFFLNIPFRSDGILWGQFLLSLLLGVWCVFAIGLFLASLMLLVDRMGWVWAEGISGMMFLAAGAVIPLSILPTPLAAFGKILPMTYWADIWRLAVYGQDSLLAQTGLSTGNLWFWFTITTLIWTIFSLLCFAICNRIARQMGRIERETFY